MINFDNFKKYQKSFGYITRQLCFPEKLTSRPKTFEETISEDHLGYDDLIAFRNIMMTFSLLEIKAIHTDIFDFTKKVLLYMMYNKSDTQEERGQMLTRLEVLYEMFGLEMADNEFSDYLSLMLQFLQVAEWRNDPRAEENIQLIIMIAEDRTYMMVNALGEDNSLYAYVIQALRKTLKLCLASSEGMKHYA